MMSVAKLSATALWSSAVALAWRPQYGSPVKAEYGNLVKAHASQDWNGSATQNAPWPFSTSHPWSPSGSLPQNITNGMIFYIVFLVLELTIQPRPQHFWHHQSSGSGTMD